jgi:hypothetical protein
MASFGLDVVPDVASGCIDKLIVEIGLTRGAVAPHLREAVGFHKPGIIVFPHAARIAVDDVFQRGDAAGEGQQLVDLFFVFGEHYLRFAVVQEVGGFFVEHVAVEPKAHPADGMGCNFGGDPIRPVVADDADDVASGNAELDHAEREILHARVVVIPGEHAPQAEILLTQRDIAAMLSGIQPEHLRIGIGLSDAVSIIHHAALSAAAVISSGSTRASSSSPR